MTREAIEMAATAIEVLAVGIIVVAIVHGTGRYLLDLRQRAESAYQRYKVQLAKALLLGLEFLVAADIVRTVALDSTLRSVITLGLLVIVRTFLSWSIVVEIEGRWPWQEAESMRLEKSTGAGRHE
jgi:uncharacterized membrane protein